VSRKSSSNSTDDVASAVAKVAVGPPANGISKLMGPEQMASMNWSGTVWRREQQPPKPELISGTLPYMAPEQTGRMNRSIESRSDLYASATRFTRC